MSQEHLQERLPPKDPPREPLPFPRLLSLSRVRALPLEARLHALSSDGRAGLPAATSGPMVPPCLLARERTPLLPAILARAASRLGSDVAHALPFVVELSLPSGEVLARAGRPLSLLRPEVEVTAGDGAPLGRLRLRLWANGGGFEALRASGRRLGTLRREGARARIVGTAGEALGVREDDLGASARITLAEGLARGEALVVLAALVTLERVAG